MNADRSRRGVVSNGRSKGPEGKRQAFSCGAEVVLDPLAIQDPRVVYLIEYIAQHPGESLTLQLMSQKVGCSPEHLSRLLKAKTRSGLRRIRREIRMTLAGVLLEEGHPIKWVADSCGWGSVEGFSRCFKLCFGMAPGGYQKDFSRVNGNKKAPWGVILTKGGGNLREEDGLFHQPIEVGYPRRNPKAQGGGAFRVL